MGHRRRVLRRLDRPKGAPVNNARSGPLRGTKEVVFVQIAGGKVLAELGVAAASKAIVPGHHLHLLSVDRVCQSTNGFNTDLEHVTIA